MGGAGVVRDWVTTSDIRSSATATAHEPGGTRITPPRLGGSGPEHRQGRRSRGVTGGGPHVVDEVISRAIGKDTDEQGVAVGRDHGGADAVDVVNAAVVADAEARQGWRRRHAEGDSDEMANGAAGRRDCPGVGGEGGRALRLAFAVGREEHPLMWVGRR